MRCTHINIRKASFILLSFLINNVQRTHMSDNHMDLAMKDHNTKNITSKDKPIHVPNDVILPCNADDVECNNLISSCLKCNFNFSCIYGETLNVTCRANDLAPCKGKREFQRSMICRYCYQTDSWEHTCDLKADCNSIATPKSNYQTNCTVDENIICLGHRVFNKNVKCNWTRGYRWSTALALSITLGGFGADRFYLGHWQEGIGKLFSFGGLGVWTLIDVILISLHYLGPADGSLYI